jgi:hypothetical protein
VAQIQSSREEVMSELVRVDAQNLETHVPAPVVWKSLTKGLSNEIGLLFDEGVVVTNASEVTAEHRDLVERFMKNLSRDVRSSIQNIESDMEKTLEGVVPTGALREHLTQHVDWRSRSDLRTMLEERVARLATMLRVDGVPVSAAVGAMLTCVGSVVADQVVGTILIEVVDEFERSHGDEPVRPFFDRDQYGRMASYVRMCLRNATTDELTSSTSHSFWLGGRAVSASTIEAFASKCLEQCCVWDFVNERSVPISNNIMKNVIGALARRCHVPPSQSAAETNATPTARFFTERLTISGRAWTSTDDIDAAWRAWCAEREIEPLGRDVLMRALSRWSRGRATLSRPRVDGRQVQGYRGVKLR